MATDTIRPFCRTFTAAGWRLNNRFAMIVEMPVVSPRWTSSYLIVCQRTVLSTFV